MPLKFTQSGSFDKTDRFLLRISKGRIFDALDSAGSKGVAALQAATPVDTGISAASWSYKIERFRGGARITWSNSHIDGNGTPLVIMLQHGHGTGTGGYVQGRDFINPAMSPIFDEISNTVWKEVTAQ